MITTATSINVPGLATDGRENVPTADEHRGAARRNHCISINRYIRLAAAAIVAVVQTIDTATAAAAAAAANAATAAAAAAAVAVAAAAAVAAVVAVDESCIDGGGGVADVGGVVVLVNVDRGVGGDI